MTRLLLLGPARDAAGVRDDVLAGTTVGDVVRAAVGRYGSAFEEVLEVSQVWLNGEPTTLETPVGDYDEVAVLPPVSGG